MGLSLAVTPRSFQNNKVTPDQETVYLCCIAKNRHTTIHMLPK
jgi:hypothetical protein